MAPSGAPNDTDPIVALATPWGESALAVIRASGKGSLGLASTLFRGRKRLEDAAGHTMAHGWIVDRSGEAVDEVLVAVYRAPRSYSGEDGLEVSCHGGPVVVSRILELFLRGGFRQARPGEFTLRAFLNGRMDLTRAEAVNEIVRARSDRGRSAALARLSGALAERVDAIKAGLTRLQSALELHLDYPPEELEDSAPGALDARAIRKQVDELLGTYASGRLAQDGARLAIAGLTNSGKSTLFNLLLREDRSIVSSTPGTTRDYVEGSIELRGFGFRVFDTAGFREPDGEVESEGIRRSRLVMENADLVAYLVDATRGISPEDRGVMAAVSEARLVRVWSKSDVGVEGAPAGFVAVSGKTGAGLPELHAAILARVGSASTEGGAVLIDSLRQKQLLERCRDALERAEWGIAQGLPLDLVAVDTKEALDALGEITGAVTTQELLEAMFAAFCVGK